jgi:hypothetical protein
MAAARRLFTAKPQEALKLITLSTIALEPGTDGKSRPAARIVDAYYEDGSPYF